MNEDEKYDQIPDGFATTEELAKALGSSDNQAKQIDTRIKYLAGNKPKVIRNPDALDDKR